MLNASNLTVSALQLVDSTETIAAGIEQIGEQFVAEAGQLIGADDKEAAQKSADRIRNELVPQLQGMIDNLKGVGTQFRTLADQVPRSTEVAATTGIAGTVDGASGAAGAPGTGEGEGMEGTGIIGLPRADAKKDDGSPLHPEAAKEGEPTGDDPAKTGGK